MKVQVSRSGATVRAREIFDVRTYEDRDWAARLSSALESPVPATSVGAAGDELRRGTIPTTAVSQARVDR